MSVDPLADESGDRGQPGVAPAERQSLTLHAEQLQVTKRVRKTLVRATRTTAERTVAVDEELARDSVVVERVAIGRIVEEMPTTRQEGDVTIIPVVEEQLVLVRQLVLKEEVHLRRSKTTVRHVETVNLREQKITVTRTDVAD